MKPGQKNRNVLSHSILFALVICLCLVIQGFFLANMVRWRNSPDIGWIPIKELGPAVIGITSPHGEKAGF